MNRLNAVNQRLLFSQPGSPVQTGWLCGAPLQNSTRRKPREMESCNMAALGETVQCSVMVKASSSQLKRSGLASHLPLFIGLVPLNKLPDLSIAPLYRVDTLQDCFKN